MLVAIYPPVPMRAPSALMWKIPPARVFPNKKGSVFIGNNGLAGLFDTVGTAIQKIEGWFPGSISYRLNNPGNLMYAGQPGAVPHPITGSDGKVRTFAEFDSLADGQAALDRQIALDASRGMSIAQFAAKYAPAQDANDPASYAAAIAAASGRSVNDPLALAGDSVGSVPAPDPGQLGASDVPFWSVDVVGQPWRGNEAGAVDVSPVAWAALAVIAGLYVASAS